MAKLFHFYVWKATFVIHRKELHRVLLKTKLLFYE